MQIEGPDRFKITILPATERPRFTITDRDGATKFSGKATSRLPKLYVVSVEQEPIYVGITTQSMRSRLTAGWPADGKHGYHGYHWRDRYNDVTLDVWYHVDPPLQEPAHDLETVEAEVVYLIRKRGQWPKHQTEIHFHESTAEHRQTAEAILSHYALS